MSLDQGDTSTVVTKEENKRKLCCDVTAIRSLRGTEPAGRQLAMHACAHTSRDSCGVGLRKGRDSLTRVCRSLRNLRLRKSGCHLRNFSPYFLT